ncbi:ArnT family glycosyltransferase [Nannocystis pusilla]|uniref:ArnT family glycosyltransferase n=1 Tax=Nannocystis pusilla TaxID=889268 RepID=UPI003BF2198B
MQRALDWLYRNRWPLVIVLGAFLVRLHWNLLVHPLGDYVSSDMKGYVSRADQMIDKFGAPNEYHAFFPYGTHFILALIKYLFGKDNFTAIGVAYALMGTGMVAYAYRIAARISPRKWVPPLLGTLLVFYYPLISLGGYTLSEIPFGVFMMASMFYLVRLVQEGRSRDAWLTGVTAALATACRPQILLSIALFGLIWLVWRKALPNVRWRHLVFAGIPLIAVLGFSAARMHHHTGRLGLVSENGKFNQLFGRCHNKKATATPTEPGRGKIRFGPPPLIQLEKRAKTAPRSWVQLEPALGPELDYRGYIADADALDALMAKCIRKTGILGQIKYGIVNMLLLAGYNTPWPDSGRDMWRPRAIWWQGLYTSIVTLPVVLGLVTLFMRRTIASYGLIAMHVLALMITAAIYFGDTRLRAPYDPLLLLLALEVYVIAGTWLWRHGKTLWERRRARRA